jgi:hypothetical protein
MRGFPTIEGATDGRRRWSWRTVTSATVTVSAAELADALRDAATANLLGSEPWNGPEGRAAAGRTEVVVTSLGSGAYDLVVTAAVAPSDWDMAFTFGVMQAFDRLAGPVIEVQGRPRTGCPPWYLSSESESSG